jgi:hypothetical protein
VSLHVDSCPALGPQRRLFNTSGIEVAAIDSSHVTDILFLPYTRYDPAGDAASIEQRVLALE